MSIFLYFITWLSSIVWEMSAISPMELLIQIVTAAPVSNRGSQLKPVCAVSPILLEYVVYISHCIASTVCVCVLSSHLFWTSDFPFILDVRLVDAPAGVTQEEGYTGFLRLPSAVLASIFLGRRIQPSLSLVDREVEFCVPTNKSFSTCSA